MRNLLRHAPAAAAVLLILAAAPAATAAPTQLKVRIEGKSSTIFEGPVTTDARAVDPGDGSGPHKCDGTNNGAPGAPGPTATTALADAAAAGGFSWHGQYFASFDDIAVDRVGPDAATSSQFWGFAVDYTPSQVGGCQQRVSAGDEVLWAFDFFSKVHLLRLSAPGSANTGQRFTVTVTDGQNGAPVAGASVGGVLTGADGRATLSYDAPGDVRLKADRADSVRSNAAVVCIHAGADGRCGTPVHDLTPPTIHVAGITDGERFSRRRAPRELHGTVDPDRSGIIAVKLRLRRRHAGQCFYFSGSLERLRRVSCGSAWYFRAGRGEEWSYLLPRRLPAGRYVLDARAIDGAHIPSRPSRGVNRIVFTVR